jgi:hypothetical protein
MSGTGKLFNPRTCRVAESVRDDAGRRCTGIEQSNLRAIIFRQQFTQMTDIVDKTLRLYNAMGAKYVDPPSWTWTFLALQTGQWQIADTCPKLIEAIPSRMHDEKRPGDVLKVAGDPLDDVADDARYGIYTFITTTEKPRELVVREDIRRLAEQGDLTSAYVRHLQMTAEPRGGR